MTNDESSGAEDAIGSKLGQEKAGDNMLPGSQKIQNIFHGPVGAVQQGDNNSAYISQDLPQRSDPLPDVSKLKAKQRPRRFNRRQQLKHLFGEIDKQRSNFGVIAATAVGRAFLIREEYELALKLFLHLHETTPIFDKERYITFGNIAYCLNALGHHDEARIFLERIKIHYKDTYFAWHALALAYAYHQLNRNGDAEEELDYAKKRPEYADELQTASTFYPEIADSL